MGGVSSVIILLVNVINFVFLDTKELMTNILDLNDNKLMKTQTIFTK